ncbi:Mercuric resistance operon regulatory protein [Brevundimonas sp. SH203]|uniref:MerR family DNA-binding protein n=1 Tax=Brevundimonas sp. SH203 TaxID=345167 RepID=UPI0009CE057C|nr:MerR family DNA-binding protein [Brevundimonas sp. SH203]GAW40270.1 Mercuric resistance operon regulatory protein [Brevundimonas sp. SH203]
MAMTIGGLARAGAVGVETIRYYQRRGLLETPAGDGTTRRYGPADADRLRFIRQAQAAGFTLAQIGELLTLDAGSDRTRVRDMAKARIEELDRQIADMQAARTALQRLASDCARGEKGPCPILKAFERPITA